MPEVSTGDRLKQAQARVNALKGTRDRIIGDIRVGEQKLKTAYESLRELGVEEPEKLTSKQLTALSEEYKTNLAASLESIEGVLETGEKLKQQYEDLEVE